MTVINNPDNSILKITAGGSEHIRLTTNLNETVPLWAAVTENGKTEILSGLSLTAESLTPEYAIITDNCRIQPKAEGIARFRVNVKCGETVYEKEAEFRVCRAKRKATYMTAEKSRAARDNISRYIWAKELADGVIKKAETYLNSIDKLYDLVGSQGVPRAAEVGEVADPFVFRCRCCNIDMSTLPGGKGWEHNPLEQPYKIICPGCGRSFPTNDFAGFYKLGLNEYGEFDRMRALEAHRELCGDKSITEPGAEHSAQWKAYYGYGSKEGYLYNKEYPELYDNAPSTLNTGKGLRDGETPETWGVDDSFGYVPSKADGTPYKYENGVVERHNYVGVFMHYGVYKRRPSKEDDTSGIVTDAIQTCAKAYFYTGEAKYGRTAAILLDRIADFYPDYTLRPFGNMMRNSHGGSHEGKIIGCIWETGLVYTFMVAYDQVYDLYSKDSGIFEYINNRSKTLKYRHSKENVSQICQNIEDEIGRAHV